MSITIEIDEALWRAAEQGTGSQDAIEPIRQLIEREIRARLAQRRLAALGGTMPDLEALPRQRTSAA